MAATIRSARNGGAPRAGIKNAPAVVPPNKHISLLLVLLLVNELQDFQLLWNCSGWSVLLNWMRDAGAPPTSLDLGVVLGP